VTALDPSTQVAATHEDDGLRKELTRSVEVRSM